MKKQMILSVIAMASVSMGTLAHASVSNRVGTWNGSGEAFSLGGDDQGGYQVQLVDTLQSDSSVASAVTVTLPDGSVKNFDQTLRDTAKGFSMSSDQGNGGAVCVGEGLCEGFFGDSSGNGVAMTIVIDGPDTFRILKTELHGFKADRIFREKYVRAQAK